MAGSMPHGAVSWEAGGVLALLTATQGAPGSGAQDTVHPRRWCQARGRGAVGGGLQGRLRWRQAEGVWPRCCEKARVNAAGEL